MQRLTSEVNWLLHICLLRLGQWDQDPLLPLHQLHCDCVARGILPGFQSNNTETLEGSEE